jgi:2-keto-4-pentenoate hydratase
MATDTKVQRAAAALLEQFHGKRKYLLEGDSLPGSIAEAYEVQDEYQGALTGAYGPVAGYKIAYTTRAVQEATGLTEPVAGVILANNVRHSPAALNSADYLQVGIECEVAARLGADLPASGAPYDRDGVSAAVDAVMTAFEVVETGAPRARSGRRSF